MKLLQKELTNAMSHAAFLELTPEHMTGKLVNESRNDCPIKALGPFAV